MNVFQDFKSRLYLHTCHFKEDTPTLSVVQYSIAAVLSALVVIHKPIWFLNEIAMGLHVSGGGADYSLCESISGAKSSNTIRASSVYEDEQRESKGDQLAP